ncbi:MAG: hypothetical protein ABI347_08495 [Nitrososphaera sp.]
MGVFTITRYSEIQSAHNAKLLELGVSESFLKQLLPRDARELLKGLLYLKEMFGREEET